MKLVISCLLLIITNLAVFGQLHMPVSCSTGVKGQVKWSSSPSNINQRDWGADGSLSASFMDVSGLGVKMDVSFSGETSTFGHWGGGDKSPCVGTFPTNGAEECLQLYTNGFGATGISITMDFDITLDEIAFDLANVNSVPGANGDLYKITALNSLGQTVYPVFTHSANPSYTSNTTGTVDANKPSTTGDNDEVGVNLSDPYGLVSFTVVWKNCSTCQPWYIHGLGIKDIEFCIGDQDADGVQNLLDIDDDNDGIPDLIETGGANPTADVDNDGVYAYLDDNDNNASIFNNNGKVESKFDFDGDNIANHLDLDSDNDGISDIAEAGGVDTDGDGQVPYIISNSPLSMLDADKDGLMDAYDASVANQQIIQIEIDLDKFEDNTTWTLKEPNGNVVLSGGPYGNSDEIINATHTATFTGNYVFTILDSHGDGLSENNGSDNSGDAFFKVKLNGAIVYASPSYFDFGFSHSVFISVVATSAGSGQNIALTNFDGKSLPDYLDLDSDNDGISDLVEANLGSVVKDANGGTVIDGMIGINGAITDVNGNGWSDAEEGVDSRVDSDGDGLVDGHDADSDNDGIIDAIEGTCTTCPQFNVVNTTDSDNDGISDLFENLTTANGNGGVNQSLRPNDDNDDADGIPDYLDIDSDDDGAFDWSEGYDTDGDGNATPELPNYAVNFSLFGGDPTFYPSDDPDGDGIPVFMDNMPNQYGIIENVRPPFYNSSSSYWHDVDKDGLVDLLDNNIPGSIGHGVAAPLPDNDGVLDLDFRDKNYNSVLPVELLYFIAEIEEGNVDLEWKTASEKNCDYFEIEKSKDGKIWEKVKTVYGTGNTNSETTYRAVDTDPYFGFSYYRLKQFDFDAQFIYSNIELVSIEETESLNVYPNPATSVVTFVGDKLETTGVRILDGMGKVVYTNSCKECMGLFKVDISHLEAGVYTVDANNELIRLVIR